MKRSNSNINGSIRKVAYIKSTVSKWTFPRHKTACNHQPGRCMLVPGVDNGYKDIKVLPNGLAFITSGFDAEIPGNILLFDFKEPRNGAHALYIVGDPDRSTFTPLGLGIWRYYNFRISSATRICFRERMNGCRLLRFDGRLRLLCSRGDFGFFAAFLGVFAFFSAFLSVFTFFVTFFATNAFGAAVSPRRKLSITPKPFDCFRAPFFTPTLSAISRCLLVDDAFVFTDVEVLHDVFQNRLSRRTTTLLQTEDGCGNHLGVLGVQRQSYKFRNAIESIEREANAIQWRRRSLYTRRADVVVEQRKVGSSGELRCAEFAKMCYLFGENALL
ncbi:hypothetical protein LSAT2_014192 [Lamellibrachia satsuma]|nr:hypothetical protein LSAT2_014192 [Lamellibrachia satsuma]